MTKESSPEQKKMFSKLGWKELISIAFLAIAVYFFWQQRNELSNLGKSLLHSNPYWLIIGIVFTGGYILLQSALYVYSFKAVKGKITWPSSIILFLKRNVIAVFLPGGGLTALGYLPSGIVHTSADRQKVHHASVVFGFIGIFSVFIVAVPVLLYLSFQKNPVPGTTAAFITVVAMLLAMFFFVRLVQKNGPLYRRMIKGRPRLEQFLIEVFSFDIIMLQFWYAVIVSVLIEVIGVVHIYISMYTAKVPPSLPASIVAYIISTIFLIISPFLRGMGAIEVSLTLILKKYGYSTVDALAIAILFRFFEFWLPLAAGLFAYVTKVKSIISFKKTNQ